MSKFTSDIIDPMRYITMQCWVKVVGLFLAHFCEAPTGLVIVFLSLSLIYIQNSSLILHVITIINEGWHDLALNLSNYSTKIVHNRLVPHTANKLNIYVISGTPDLI